jgi:hypothetical protein
MGLQIHQNNRVNIACSESKTLKINQILLRNVWVKVFVTFLVHPHAFLGKSSDYTKVSWAKEIQVTGHCIVKLYQNKMIYKCHWIFRIKLYGENVITIDVKSYWQLFVEEVFNPFYIFQAFSVILWSLDDYFYYAGCIVFLTTVSVVTSLLQTRKVRSCFDTPSSFLVPYYQQCQHSMSKCMNLLGESNISSIRCRVMSCEVLGLQKICSLCLTLCCIFWTHCIVTLSDHLF